MEEPGDSQTEQEGAAAVKDDPHCETCPDCEPRQVGEEVPRFYGDVRLGAQIGYDYQHFACPWHAHRRSKMIINEWHWAGLDYDGLHPAECLLLECKQGYDDLLIDDGWEISDRPLLNPDKKWAEAVFRKMVTRATAKLAPIRPLFPNVRMKYVFSHSITKVYVGERFRDSGLFEIELEHSPFAKENT